MRKGKIQWATLGLLLYSLALRLRVASCERETKVKGDHRRISKRVVRRAPVVVLFLVVCDGRRAFRICEYSFQNAVESTACIRL
jgi:hypothetical protein